MRRRRYGRGLSFRRKHRQFSNLALPAAIILAAVLAICLLAWAFRGFQGRKSEAPSPVQAEESSPSLPEEAPASVDQLIAQANRLAAGYDYDKAIQLLQNSEFSQTEEAASAIQGYEEEKASLVRANPSQITHVFFHSLIIDTGKAFDGDGDQNGYNQVMTTKDEFLRILEQMHDRGYVLVRLHDIAYETTDEKGNVVFKEGDIMLPQGKKPFVMSQDDVCYYEYMEGDGFASRIVIGEDGKPACEMELEDGTVVTGSYDLIPLLEDFIQEHPDFSYRGARAVIAFTGYNGILGYRTDESYRETNPNLEEDRETARKVAQCLRDNGWELASHSWGHKNMGEIDMDNFRADTDKWESQVESLIGPTDIILFPYGSDIGDWHKYTFDNQRFSYLYDKGFRYFCNVDSARYWVQIGDSYFRQGRRNLDGFRMYYDLPETNPKEDHLSDLFDVSQVFDRSRPVPVPMM